MPSGAYPPMLRRRRQRRSGLGWTTGTIVLAGAGSIRGRASVGQTLPTGHEGICWAALTKLHKALVERAGEIYVERDTSAPGESPIKGEDLTSEQLESVAAEVFEELGNMDQTPVQHEMPADDSREAWRKGRSHQHRR